VDLDLLRLGDSRGLPGVLVEEEGSSSLVRALRLRGETLLLLRVGGLSAGDGDAEPARSGVDSRGLRRTPPVAPLSAPGASNMKLRMLRWFLKLGGGGVPELASLGSLALDEDGAISSVSFSGV
jgi:hypothetical protein